MKGIKKLFLGLLFTTIVGISFQSEVKAASVSYNETDQTVTFTVSGLDGATTPTTNINVKGIHASSTNEPLTFTYDTTESKWSAASYPTGYTLVESDVNKIVLKVDKSVITKGMGTPTGGATSNETLTLKVGDTDSGNVTIGAVCPKVELVGFPSNPVVSLDKADQWLLKGETYNYTFSGECITDVHKHIFWDGDDKGNNFTTIECTSDGTAKHELKYVYDAITGFSLSNLFDKKICVGKESYERYIDGVISEYGTWTPNDLLNISNWNLDCFGATVTGKGRGVSEKFKVKTNSEGDFTINARGKGLTEFGSEGTVELASFTSVSDASNKINLSPMPVRVALGGSVRIAVTTPEGFDKKDLMIEQDHTYYDAEFADENNNEIVVTGLIITSSPSYSYIRVYSNNLEPSGGLSSIKVPVYVEGASDISYSLDDPRPVITVREGDTADILFSEMIYEYQGFAPTDDLQWIIPDAYKEIAVLEPKNGIGKDVKVKGLKKGTAKVYLKVDKGENKVFPKPGHQSEYYITINVKEKFSGDPSYTLYEDAEINVKLGESEPIYFDTVISDAINWDPEDDSFTYKWVVQKAYKQYAQIEQSDEFYVKGTKIGTAKAYMEIRDSDTGELLFPIGTVASKYLLPINVSKDDPSPTGTPTPTPTSTPGQGLALSNPIDLTVGATDYLSTFVTSGLDDEDYSVEYMKGYIDVSSNPSGSYKLNNITLKAASKSSKSTISVYNDEDSATSTVIVYPKVVATKDSSGVVFLIPQRANTGKASSHIITTGALVEAKFGSTVYVMSGSSWGSSSTDTEVSVSNAKDDYTYTLTLGASDLKALGKKILKDGSGGSSITIAACPVGNVFGATSTKAKNTEVASSTTVNVYKVTLNEEGNAKYTVDGESVSGSFYAIEGVTYTIASSAKTSGYTFDKWEGGESTSATITDYKFSSSKTLKANYKSTSSSSSSSSSSSKQGSSTTPSSNTNKASGGSGGSGSDYDDVPRTGESKADIWILWSVLLLSILGAGYMVYRRFGLVNAIAQVEAEEAIEAQITEVQEKEQEKEENLQMLKDLRNIDE